MIKIILHENLLKYENVLFIKLVLKRTNKIDIQCHHILILAVKFTPINSLNHYIHTHTHMHMHSHSHTYIYSYTYSYSYPYHNHNHNHTRTHKHTHTRTHTHTYIYIYIYTYTHTHIHTYLILVLVLHTLLPSNDKCTIYQHPPTTNKFTVLIRQAGR